MPSKAMTRTLDAKSQLMVPTSVRRRAGLKAGDRLEFRVSGGIITITPKMPSADDEYTVEQRRIVDAKLDQAEKGPFHGPFDSADEMIAHLKAGLKTRASVTKPKSSR